MNKDNIIAELNQKGLTDIIELIEDAQTGDLEELELVESIGLIHGEQLNQAVLGLLQELGVKITYVQDDEENEDSEDGENGV